MAKNDWYATLHGWPEVTIARGVDAVSTVTIAETDEVIGAVRREEKGWRALLPDGREVPLSSAGNDGLRERRIDAVSILRAARHVPLPAISVIRSRAARFRPTPAHNHMTRVAMTYGYCPACDHHRERQILTTTPPPMVPQPNDPHPDGIMIAASDIDATMFLAAVLVLRPDMPSYRTGIWNYEMSCWHHTPGTPEFYDHTNIRTAIAGAEKLGYSELSGEDGMNHNSLNGFEEVADDLDADVRCPECGTYL